VADVSHESPRVCRLDGFLHRATLTGRVLFVLIVLSHHRRRIVKVNVTDYPRAAWSSTSGRRISRRHGATLVYSRYYHRSRTHLGLEKDTPDHHRSLKHLRG
jgi:hypothetical protein